MTMKNFFNTTGFHWWMGVVEDRMDPLYLGRCRVRILGYHNKDKTILPTADLPWSTPIQPITSAAITGIGTAPVGPVEGTWVVGFFADGDDCQQPIMMGTFAGIPQSDYEQKIPANEGFRDPNKKYPLTELLNEPDTNRLARNQSITETIVQKKKDARDEGVDIAFSGTWDQPKIPYGTKYPFNHVTFTESGHAVELDDTPSAERLHVYHKAGSFVEIDRGGSMVRRIVGNDYQIIDANEFIHIRGKANITVDGSCNIYVKNNCNLQVDGDLKAHAHGNIEMKAGKKMLLTAKENIEIKTDANFNVDASNVINMKSLKGMNLTGTLKTTIASPITEIALLKMNAMSITPVPPKPPVFTSPSTINSKSPTEPEISDPAFALTSQDRLEFTQERIEAEANKDAASKEYASLKQAELDGNERVSVETTEPIAPVVACEAAKKVVEAAKKDVGILETGTAANKGAGKNYGGLVGGGETPPGQPGRIDEMVRIAGLNNQAQVRATGQGYYWCASAVAAWWKAAGLPIPPGAAACKNWATWGKERGLYSKTPKIGAAALYGIEGSEHHIGVVVEIGADGSIKTIEGNTGGAGFNRNGCGCFVKTPNRKPKDPKNGISGYVHVPENCVAPAPATIDSACMSAEMKAYVEKLKGSIPEKIRQQIPDVVCKFKINTPLRMAHFLAQCGHESHGFEKVREELSYGKAGLRNTWPKRFPTDEIAAAYARNPEKIANRAYSNKNGNGDEASGDGWKYRGRGYIQLTGKNNYKEFSKFVPEDCVANPELVAEKYPLLSAAWFFATVTNPRTSLDVSDKGDTVAVVTQVTQVINGGRIGLDDRVKRFNQFNSLA